MSWRWRLILLGLAIAWLVGLNFASRAFFDLARDSDANAKHFAQKLAALEVHAEVHVSGNLAPTAQRLSPILKRSCTASKVYVSYGVQYAGADGKPTTQAFPGWIHLDGPESIDILVGSSHLAVPLDRWRPDDPAHVDEDNEIRMNTSVNELPVELRPTPEQQKEANEWAKHLGHSDARLTMSVSEDILRPEAAVFVAGRIASRAENGAWVLEADPFLNQVMLVPGSQAAYVERQYGNIKADHVGGWIFFALSLVPLILYGALSWRAWQRARRIREHGGA